MADAVRTSAAVGFVGLGNIGKPMALRLAASEHDLWVYDVAAGPLDELGAAGASVAHSVADLAGRVDLVCVMVRDDDQVCEVVDEVLGSGRGRLVIAIHSTVGPHTPVALANLARAHDVEVVDAPVSGGAMGATDGTLAIMVGGSDSAYAACAGPLAVLGSLVIHAGPIGSGTRMKLARNLMHFVAFTAATEAQRLAEACGLDLVELGRVVRHTDAITGGPGAIMHRDTARPMAVDDPWRGIFNHVLALGEKDLRFATALADELGVEVPLAELALERLGPGLGLTVPSPATKED